LPSENKAGAKANRPGKHRRQENVTAAKILEKKETGRQARKTSLRQPQGKNRQPNRTGNTILKFESNHYGSDAVSSKPFCRS